MEAWEHLLQQLSGDLSANSYWAGDFDQHWALYQGNDFKLLNTYMYTYRHGLTSNVAVTFDASIEFYF